jgi:hypothetical protein
VGDVFIEDERVSLIGESLDIQADKVIDDETRLRRYRSRPRPVMNTT